MGIFSDLKTKDKIEDTGDTLGGRGLLEAGTHEMVIDVAYVDKSKGGAASVNFIFKNKEGQQMKVTEYVTSGDAKGNKNYYEKDKKKFYLPGFNTVNSIALLSVGKELTELEAEEKIVKVYDFKQSKEVPMPKQVLTQLTGAQILLGVQKQIVDKNVQDAQGSYVPSGYTRIENVIGKAFRLKDGLTVTEIKAEAKDTVFKEAWEEANTGKTVDRSAAKQGHIPAPKNGDTAKTGAATAPASKSLFK